MSARWIASLMLSLLAAHAIGSCQPRIDTQSMPTDRASVSSHSPDFGATVEASPSTTPIPTSILNMDARLYAGPGNVYFEVVAELPEGEAVELQGRYGDFVRVVSAEGHQGYVWEGVLERTTDSLPRVGEGQVPEESINLMSLIYDMRSEWRGDHLVLDNSDHDDGYGYYVGPIPLHSEFRLDIEFSSEGDYAGIPLYGSLATDVTGVRPMMILKPGGSIQFQNGLTYDSYPLQARVPEGEPFSLEFDHAQGRSFSLIDNSGHELIQFDVTAELETIPSAEGLFPYRELYFDLQAFPHTTLDLATLRLSQPPVGIYRPAAEARCELQVGEQEVVLTREQLEARGLHYWPDGVMGVFMEEGKAVFVAGNSEITARAVGSLDNPIAESVIPRAPIRDMQNHYPYASGGPLYRHESGMLLMIYHAEREVSADPHWFGSELGMARSLDGGATWLDLGIILSPEHTEFIPGDYPIDAGSGTILRVGKYFYIYFADSVNVGDVRSDTHVAVARAPFDEVIAAAHDEAEAVEWHKYYEGHWNQPGLGGLSTPLEIGNPGGRPYDVKYSEEMDRFVAIISADVAGTSNLYFAESGDGLQWTPRKVIDESSSDEIYPTIVGMGEDPIHPGSSFYVYYVDSPNWYFGNGFKDAPLVRRLISCTG